MQQGTTMARKRTLPETAYHVERKPISDADKEFSNEYESDTDILEYDSGEASVESEEKK